MYNEVENGTRFGRYDPNLLRNKVQNIESGLHNLDLYESKSLKATNLLQKTNVDLYEKNLQRKQEIKVNNLLLKIQTINHIGYDGLKLWKMLMKDQWKWCVNFLATEQVFQPDFDKLSIESLQTLVKSIKLV